MMSEIDYKAELEKMGKLAKSAARQLASFTTSRKNKALESIIVADEAPAGLVASLNCTTIQSTTLAGIDPTLSVPA